MLPHELRSAIASRNLGGNLYYWRTPSGAEVDFVWSRGPHAIGFEVKSAATWRSEYGTALSTLLDQGVLTAGHGVYTGSVVLKDGPLHVWPLMRFLRELASGNILG